MYESRAELHERASLGWRVRGRHGTNKHVRGIASPPRSRPRKEECPRRGTVPWAGQHEDCGRCSAGAKKGGPLSQQCPPLKPLPPVCGSRGLLGRRHRGRGCGACGLRDAASQSHRDWRYPDQRRTERADRVNVVSLRGRECDAGSASGVSVAQTQAGGQLQRAGDGGRGRGR